MPATDAVAAIRAGKLDSAELVRACLDRIAEAEGRVGAWAFLDPEHALAQARRADEARREGQEPGPILREMIERGQAYPAVEYNRALEQVPRLNRALEEIFAAHDAILTPATTGTAPVGLESTGSPIFCTIWTLCGVPAITLPLLTGADGMPLGVQLVGRRGDDGRLLRTARWLAQQAPSPPATG
ncbi:MAG: hypothetical protein HYV62_14895 [Candidatus Rokubacteria bacterium]|nr:hypothetical protein [Candidatus Rokubacteria bacterium]